MSNFLLAFEGFKGNTAIGFVAVLAIILFATKFFGILFRRIGLPQVLGYIIAGILVGPSIFGELFYKWFGGGFCFIEIGRAHL